MRDTHHIMGLMGTGMSESSKRKFQGKKQGKSKGKNSGKVEGKSRHNALKKYRGWFRIFLKKAAKFKTFKKLSASKKKVITAKTQAAVARMVKKFWAKARKVKGRAKHKKKTLRKLIRKYKRKALGFWKRLQSTARKFKTKKRGKKKGKKLRLLILRNALKKQNQENERLKKMVRKPPATLHFSKRKNKMQLQMHELNQREKKLSTLETVEGSKIQHKIHKLNTVEKTLDQVERKLEAPSVNKY